MVGPFPGAPVILISIGTLRSDRLPAWDYGRVQTPNIDGLSRDEVLFARVYTQSPLTLPSHLSITDLWQRRIEAETSRQPSQRGGS